MSDDLERLQRWIDSGGLFRVLRRRGGEYTVALCTCDGGAQMDRVVTDDPGLPAWRAAHVDSELEPA
ncbi:hypothetical protein ACFQNE_06775 [Gordonia phosphorivorans]|uniref:Uncharacterized protein n=1 Tax=Gordonia phosphorivorans TaxID=1056982 RepID=A0ABV6H4I9_9ACTN